MSKATNKPFSGDRLRELRKAHKLTQDEIAKIIGLGSRQIINDYEHGRRTPKLAYLVVMSKRFNVPIEDFLVQSK